MYLKLIALISKISLSYTVRNILVGTYRLEEKILRFKDVKGMRLMCKRKLYPRCKLSIVQF